MNSKLNPNAQAWVDALRSGEYKQATERLCIEGKNGSQKFCCLGVDCEIYKKSGNPISKKKRPDGEVAYAGSVDVLPTKVMNWLGLYTRSGDFKNESGFSRSLTGINDNGASFNWIAKIIESKPAGLFVEEVA